MNLTAPQNGTPSWIGVNCPRPGSLELAPDDPISDVALRFGLELAWLMGHLELTPAAASVLAARAAGCFGALHQLPQRHSRLHAILESLTAQSAEPAVLVSAAHELRDTHPGTGDLTAHDIACCEALWPLALPTECLLAAGGDDRLTLDPATGTNRYGCTPWPREETIAFSSCTASSLSAEAFDAAEMARQSLVRATLRTAPSVALADASDEIAASLLDHFGVADLAEAVLAASGTDAALVVTGLLAAEQPGRTLTSILMSPSETGSGVPDAVQGRHFASSAAAGCKVGKGQPIEGMSRGPDLVTVALRDATGAPRPMERIAAECDAAIRSALAAGGHVVLHTIDGSKTGLTAPDRATCRRLSEAYGGKLDIVVDACQARIEPALVRWYLQQGFPVLVTGSKFFGAPGFCGAVLFPRARLQRITRHGRLPAGLAPYARLDGGFGSRRCPGLVLRWRAALHQMKVFAALPPREVGHRLDLISRSVQAALRADGRLRLVDAPRPRGFGWSGRRSVFTCAVQAGERWLSTAELRLLYNALALDLSDLAETGRRHTAAQLCLIGQPVELGGPGTGGLRIAISAEQVVSTSQQQPALSMIVAKLSLLLDTNHATLSTVLQDMHDGRLSDSRALLTG